MLTVVCVFMAYNPEQSVNWAGHLGKFKKSMYHKRESIDNTKTAERLTWKTAQEDDIKIEPWIVVVTCVAYFGQQMFVITSIMFQELCYVLAL